MPVNRTSVLVFTVACLGGMILGTVIRPAIPTLTGNAVEPSEAVPSTAPRSASVLTKRSTPPSNPSSQARTQELAKLPASQRILWLATQAESATPDQMAQLVALAKKENHMDIELARALSAQWADLDPVHMMTTLASTGENDYRLWSLILHQTGLLVWGWWPPVWHQRIHNQSPDPVGQAGL